MVKNLFDVSGRIVVVTGGLGQLGRQFSLALADRGARVAIFDARAENSLIAERFAGYPIADRIAFYKVNITQRDSLEMALEEINANWGVPHALINNAALDSPPDSPADENGPFETYPEISLDKVIDVNLKGTILCCQTVGGRMAQAGRGSIVNISSIYGLVSPDQRIYEYRAKEGMPFFKPVAYSVSKSGLLNLTRYLATYWAKKGVRVNTLTFAGVFNNQEHQFLTNYCAHVPLGRMAHEDEYNGAVLFLVSNASTYMTGSNLIIDGGWTAW